MANYYIDNDGKKVIRPGPTHCPNGHGHLETDADLKFCALCDFEEPMTEAVARYQGFANLAEMRKEHGHG